MSPRAAPVDTIVAIATAQGQAGIGVLRLSGPRAFMIARRITGRKAVPRQVRWARFYDSERQLIDTGLLLAFAAPASYTGEDVVELHAHGSPVVLAQLLERSLALGARAARAGEFTERAFLNHKLDLAQAEAVADLIASTSRAQARAAQRSLQGQFSERIERLLRALVALRTHVEAAIDFPEEEIDFLADRRILERLEHLECDVEAVLLGARRGQRLRDGLHAVILGPPNAGKSSLFNALAGTQRAIVTEIPGTTRDLLRESIQLNGLHVSLVDTAGLRESQDPIEQEGIRRAKQELDAADVALLVLDASSDCLDDARALLQQACPTGCARIWVYNKIDACARAPHLQEESDGALSVWVSAKNALGLEGLLHAMGRFAGSVEEGAWSARERHVRALERVQQALRQARANLQERAAGELVAEDLRQAQHALSEITGSYTSDDLLGAIFSSFCIGK